MSNSSLLRTAEVMRQCVAKQISEDIKQHKTDIDEIVYAAISVMEDHMLENRSFRFAISEDRFDVLPESCQSYAIQCVIDKMRELGYTVTREEDMIKASCEA